MLNSVSPPYKICFVASSFFPAVVYGGPTFSNLSLCENIQSENFRIQVLTTNANVKSKLDVSTRINHKRKEYLSIKYFDETIIGRFSFDFFRNGNKYFMDCHLIHCVDLFSTMFLRTLYSRNAKNTIILISPRGGFAKWGLLKRQKIKHLWIRKFVSKHLDRIKFLATAEKEKNEIQDVLPNAEVSVIPNGIRNLSDKEIQNFKRKKTCFIEKYELDIKEGQFIISSLGRMHKKKGFSILIDAIRRLDFEFALVLAGPEGPETKRLLESIAKPNMDGVYILNNLATEDKNILLSFSDVFALPSFDENFGNVYLEALNLGTAIVASTNTPWREVSNFNSGLWVDNTPKAFANAIAEIRNKPNKFTTANCLKHAAKYSTEITNRMIKDLYKKLILSQTVNQKT